jgi:hypothetical protein
MSSAVISLLAVHPLTGQVGHPPGDSPFRDIRKGHTLTGLAGYLGGSGGQFNIGPHTISAPEALFRSGLASHMGVSIASSSIPSFDWSTEGPAP